MQDEQAEQQDENVEPAEDETTAEAGVDQQAAESAGTAAEQEPEVPDDASEKIAAAQEHIDNLNMDEEREAAKRAI